MKIIEQFKSASVSKKIFYIFLALLLLTVLVVVVFFAFKYLPEIIGGLITTILIALGLKKKREPNTVAPGRNEKIGEKDNTGFTQVHVEERTEVPDIHKPSGVEEKNIEQVDEFGGMELDFKPTNLDKVLEEESKINDSKSNKIDIQNNKQPNVINVPEKEIKESYEEYDF